MNLERVYAFFETGSLAGDRIARFICFPMSVTFVVVILIQVFFRYVLKSPIEWYLEVVEISYMWALFMGISIAFKTGSHIQFIFLFNAVNPKLQRVVSFSCQLLSVVFFLFIVIYGFRFFSFSRNYMMPTIEISQQWKFLCVPLSGLIMLFHSLELVFGSLIDITTNSGARRDYFRRA